MKWLIMTSFLLMPSFSTAEVLSINDFSGGMNTRDPSFRVATGFSPYMRNVFVDNGKLEGIKGAEILGTTNTLNKVTGIFPYKKESGVETFLVTDSSITLETADFVSYAFVSSGSNSGALLVWMQARGKMWGFNGVDFVRTWDGATVKRLGLEANTPNVPKFKYGEYWQERVWGLNNPNGVSDLDFSDVSSTDGVRLEPDDVRAWPATNNLKIGEGDGEFGTALWVQDGQLRVGKEGSVHTIFGTNSSNYFPRKEENIGDGVASDESVVSLDGHVYWMGQHGIYEDGVRISDLIEDEVESINKESVQSLAATWETKADFDKGLSSGTRGSTITANGVLTVSTANFAVTATIQESLGGAPTLSSGSTFYGPLLLNFGQNVSSGQLVYVHQIKVPSCAENCGAKIHNPYTGEFSLVKGDSGGGSVRVVTFSSPSILFDGGQVSASSVSVTFVYLGGNSGVVDTPITITFTPSSTGQYMSDVATLTSVTAWGNFNSENAANGGNLSFYIRSSTGIVNITTQAWKSISPGAIIGEPTQNRFVQWATTIQGVVANNPPQVENVEILHIEGSGSHNRAFAILWENRYWLATSTTASDELSFILVKSKITNKNPSAWMPVEFPVRAFAKNGDIFYVGASTWGAFYRMDYGTTFLGKPIPFEYDTPDMILGSNYMTKNILKYYLDAEKDVGLTWDVKTSIDGGAFSTKSVSFDGSGRKLHILKGVTNPAKTLRIRLSNGQLGLTRNFYDLSVEYEPTNVIEPK